MNERKQLKLDTLEVLKRHLRRTKNSIVEVTLKMALSSENSPTIVGQQPQQQQQTATLTEVNIAPPGSETLPSDNQVLSKAQQPAQPKQKNDVPGSGGGGGAEAGGGVKANAPNSPDRAIQNVAAAVATEQLQSPPGTPNRSAQVPLQTIPVETKYGIITAHVQGDLEQMENRGVFLTVHDIGSNSRSFLDFTEHPIMSAIKLRSLFIHVDLIGQQDNQQDLPDDFEFPPIKTIGEELLVEVLDKLKIKLIVGIGEGAGANILVRFANKYHSRVLGLVLIHLAPAGVGVLERLKSQISTGKRRFSEFSAENIVELHRLGDTSGRSGQSSPPPQSEQQQLMPLYSNRVYNMNAKNIKRYAISYMNRKELPLIKDLDILLVAGSRSPYLNGTQKYFAQCDKEKTSFLKVDHVVDVLTEAPEKLAKSILLFVKVSH